MSKTNPTVYLAGPITGLSFGTCTSWRDDVSRELKTAGIVCFSPLRFKQYLNNGQTIENSYLTHTLSMGKSINERDHFDCKTCDLILVNLIGTTKVSIGTVMEIAWGFAYRKPVVVALEKGSVHDHAMLVESSSFIVPSLAEAVKVTKAILCHE